MEELEQIKSNIKNFLDNPTYTKWIEPLIFIRKINNIVIVGSENKKNIVWINKHLLKKLNLFLKNKYSLSLKLISLSEDDSDYLILSSPSDTANIYNLTNLIPKYTFQSFVVADSNRMAFSFAQSVSDLPGKSYNPLYIYSDVGFGKTHLMQAIGNRIFEKNSHLKVVYITSTDFMNEYVEYTRLKKSQEFKKKYSSVDVFLIDDIQYITKWGGTRDQFYYIFNKLIQMEKQIVLCSDSHPDNIPDLEHRIKSRFFWGGIVDILPYDLEARIAILKQKIEDRKKIFDFNFELSDDILYFIASSIKDNIRKLEGALNRLIGYANLKFSSTSNVVITLPFTKEALKPLISTNKKTITIKMIQEFVAKKFNLSPNQLKSKNNSKKIAVPRQIAMYLSKKYTDHSLSHIGKSFGGKHHSTVLHSINKIKTMLVKKNDELAENIKSYVKYFDN